MKLWWHLSKMAAEYGIQCRFVPALVKMLGLDSTGGTKPQLYEDILKFVISSP